MSSDVIIGASPEACALIRAVGLDPAFTKRVIIDIDAESVVKVYVEGFADVRHFDIQKPLPDIRARVYVPGPNGPIDVTACDEEVASG